MYNSRANSNHGHHNFSKYNPTILHKYSTMIEWFLLFHLKTIKRKAGYEKTGLVPLPDRITIAGAPGGILIAALSENQETAVMIKKHGLQLVQHTVLIDEADSMNVSPSHLSLGTS